MNLYIRFFDNETLVHNVDDAITFLADIPDIGMNEHMANDIRDYYNSDVYYPKRYKVRQKIYFIIIKTEAETMQDFKDKKAVHSFNNTQKAEKDRTFISNLNKYHAGWYEGHLNFKRVTMDPSTGKYIYVDTQFVARTKATSGMDCYKRCLEYLIQRVDRRSQFPSVNKGKNFHFIYLGKAK